MENKEKIAILEYIISTLKKNSVDKKIIELNPEGRARGHNWSEPRKKKEVTAYVVIKQNVIAGKNLVLPIDNLEPDQLEQLKNAIRDWAEENEQETVIPVETGELGLEITEVQCLGTPNPTFAYVTEGEFEGSRDRNKANLLFFDDIRNPKKAQHRFPDGKDGSKRMAFARIVLRGDAGEKWKKENKKK